MTSPRSLEELLSQVGKSVRHPDESISSHPWAKRFTDHLEARDMTDELAAFKFLVYTQPIASLWEDDNQKKKKKKRPVASVAKAREVLEGCHDLFLDEGAPEQICLSNPELRERLREACKRLKADSGREPGEEDVSLLFRARRDPDVWQEGAEKRLARFLSQQPHQGPLACLLSIL